MNRKIIGIGIAIAVVAVVATFSYNLYTNHPSESVNVTIAYNKLVGSWPLFVALDQGYFKEAGLNVTAIPEQDSGLVTSALIANQADVGLPIATTDLFLLEDKTPGSIKLFMEDMDTNNSSIVSILVKPGSTIKTIEDIKGKKFGIYPGSVGLMVPKLMFSKYFDPNDVTYVQMPPTSLLSALTSEQIDASYSAQPLTAIATSKGLAISIMDAATANTIHDPFPLVGFGFNSEFIKEHPDTAKKIVKIMENSINYISSNPQEARAILANYTNIPPSITDKVALPTFEEPQSIENVLQLVADKMYAENFTSRQVNASDTIYLPS